MAKISRASLNMIVADAMTKVIFAIDGGLEKMLPVVIARGAAGDRQFHEGKEKECAASILDGMVGLAEEHIGEDIQVID
jgi:hypothetical protein